MPPQDAYSRGVSRHHGQKSLAQFGLRVIEPGRQLAPLQPIGA
jgi:hypothetical protein